MGCEKEPYDNNDFTIHHPRCELRKNHKGMCKATFTLSWYGKEKGDV